jgi:hypothetical protein
MMEGASHCRLNATALQTVRLEKMKALLYAIVPVLNSDVLADHALPYTTSATATIAVRTGKTKSTPPA